MTGGGSSDEERAPGVDPASGSPPGSDPLDVPSRLLLVDAGHHDGQPVIRLLLAGAALAGAAVVASAVLSAPPRPTVLPALVAERLEASGVSNPVTAVLLNFRSYDTLLEIAVLLVAMVAVWSMDRGARILGREKGEDLDDPVLRHLIRLVVPLAGVVAVYLTWAGSMDTGGAFQAGALLAGAGVLLVAAGFLRPPDAETRLVRGLVAMGLYAFIGVGVAVIPFTGAFLEYPSGWAYPLILGIEAVLTVAIAVVLVELFVDVPAVPARNPALEDLDPTGDPLGRVLPLREPLDPEGTP